MTRRDYVLLAKALGMGFGELLLHEKRKHPKGSKASLYLAPTEMTKGFIAAMGAVAIVLQEDNGRFDLPMFFKNIGETASLASGEKVELDAIAVAAEESRNDDTPTPDSAGTIH